MTPPAWIGLLRGDPTEWLLASGEPAAVWITRTALEQGTPGQSAPDAVEESEMARQAVLRDAGTQELISRISDWEVESQVSGHNSPKYAPNLLLLLSDMGVHGGDDSRIEHVLDQMSAHQDAGSHFQSYGRGGHGSIGRLAEPVWGSLLCDHHAITQVLIRYGRSGDPRVQAAVDRIARDITATAQGPAWLCIPDTTSGFRGPGRKADFCPQVTVEALRALALLPEKARSVQARAGHDARQDTLREAALTAARTLIGAWLRRSTEQPYMFGHGYRFKTVKWPAFWYDVHAVLDAIAGYLEVWAEAPAGSPERRAVSEMVACLVAYNFGPDGKVTPKSCYKGFESFSFGQKKRPSPFATARLASLLKRFEPLAGEIQTVDIRTLESSRGGSGTPVPPK